MKYLVIAAVLLAALAGQVNANKGAECAACTLVIGLSEQTMQVRNIDAKAAMDTICSFLPKGVPGICDLLVNILGPGAIPLMNKHIDADTVCNAIGFCKAENQVCRLFPKSTARLSDREFVARAQSLRAEHPVADTRSFNICTVLPMVCRVADHLPFSDDDGDHFSTDPTLRGSYWRGKDCDDKNANVYPGARSDDSLTDGNCNGINGTDPTTGRSYEEQWCSNTGAIGIASLGDSATAHFRIPQEYLMASTMHSGTFKDVLTMLENEADWPMFSWSTGHMPTTKFNPTVAGPCTSIYSKLFDLNHCNHRDFQNLGVNGARSNSLVDWVTLTARNNQKDKPLIAVFSMIGNDVCNGHHTFDTMTKPDVYYKAVYDAVMAADKKFPKGSHVVLIPLVDGRILYDTMHARIHPIGALNKDVTYTDLYNFLNCLDTSPCWGWMNDNVTVRNTTWEIAQSLNKQLPKVVSDTKNILENINVFFTGPIFDEALNNFPGPKYELIEPVDGFHPSQLSNSLIGNITFNVLQQAGIIPMTSNPNNANIKNLFGDQGGY